MTYGYCMEFSQPPCDLLHVLLGGNGLQIRIHNLAEKVQTPQLISKINHRKRFQKNTIAILQYYHMLKKEKGCQGTTEPEQKIFCEDFDKNKLKLI